FVELIKSIIGDEWYRLAFYFEVFGSAPGATNTAAVHCSRRYLAADLDPNSVSSIARRIEQRRVLETAGYKAVDLNQLLVIRGRVGGNVTNVYPQWPFVRRRINTDL